MRFSTQATRSFCPFRQCHLKLEGNTRSLGIMNRMRELLAIHVCLFGLSHSCPVQNVTSFYGLTSCNSKVIAPPQSIRRNSLRNPLKDVNPTAARQHMSPTNFPSSTYNLSSSTSTASRLRGKKGKAIHEADSDDMGDQDAGGSCMFGCRLSPIGPASPGGSFSSPARQPCRSRC